ncbi:MAG: amidase [Actinobacteria bacterium]|nr:amidase [Actinomycetota bacterium]
MSAVAAELAGLDATALAELVTRGELTSTELVEAAIECAEALNPILNAVATPMYERALANAHSATGPFSGVPMLLKDLVAEVEGIRFTEGSRFLVGNVSTRSSELVLRYERAGLVIIGKSATPEFGMSPSCEAVLFGPTRNPWDLDRSTSGSSGGSAAAVAAGIVAIGHANDLGGSIRYPASNCGVFGLKPTRARNPLGPEYGDAISGWAVEHAVTRSVRDSAALLDATSGPMPGDPYAAALPDRPFLAEVGADPGRLRIGYTGRIGDGSLGHPDCIAGLDATVALLVELGHHVVETRLPAFTEHEGAAIGIVFSSATAWILDYWIKRLGREPAADEIEPLTRAYWEMGKHVSAAAYLRSIETLQRYSRRIATSFAGFDVFLNPTVSAPPLRLGEMVSTDDEPLRAADVGSTTVAYSGVIANLTGNPAMSVPLHWNDETLPIGMHFLGRYGDEATLLRLAGQLEQARPWADRRPPVFAS